MKIIKNFRSYLLEDNFSVHIYKGKVNIINYTNVGHISDTKIIINYEDGSINITGKNLSILRMVDDELLISGTINNIELR